MSERPVSVSVVIPAYNAAATIAECLTALNAQSLPRTDYEVIVVDDGSIDDTADIAARYGARVLRQANSGPAAARNRGVNEARADIVLFTDSDCVPSPEWLEEMIGPFADPQVAGVKGVYRTRQRNLTARFIQIEYEDRYDHTARCKYVDLVDTYAAGYRRNILISNGGFDIRFRFLEDQELSFRLTHAGHKMVFNPRAVVYHYHPESWRRYAQRKYRIGYWKTRVLRLHPSKAWRDSHTPWSLKVQMLLTALSAPLACLSIWVRPCVSLLGVIATAFLVTCIPFMVKAWRRDHPVALVSLPALYIRAWSLGFGVVAGYMSMLRQRGAPTDAQKH
ncbi:MAG: glycosyltransferase [Chloroflexi bacterium]|nr:glycosyltransferase [Chloroflexota bacterium]